MTNLLKKFKDFFKPDKADFERVKRWEEEMTDPDKPKKSLTFRRKCDKTTIIIYA